MKDGLADAYSLIVEKSQESSGTVKGTSMAPGKGFEGGEKKAPGRGTESPAAKGVKKPVEGPDSKRTKIKTESKEIEDMIPQSKFDALFKAQLVEESPDLEGAGDESPLEQDGDEGFSDDGGDFPPEGDGVDEEVDVATELRLIIDRLTEVAEKLGAFEGEEEGAGMEGEGEGEMPAPEMGEGEGEMASRPELGEGVVKEAAAGGPGKGAGDGKLKSFKDSAKQMQSKTFKVKSSFDVTSHKTGAAGGPGKQAADGKLKPFKKSTLGPKMSMKADVKGVMGKPGAGLFDSI